MDTEVKEKTQVEKIEDSIKNYKCAHETKFSKFSKLGNWMEKESTIFKNETAEKEKTNPKFKRGEIIKVDFGINIGSELSNTHFAIVLNSDDTQFNDNIVVIPITSKNGYRRIPLGRLLKKAMPKNKKYTLECYGSLTQIKTISKKRIFETHFRYICNQNILDKIDSEIVKYLTKPIKNTGKCNEKVEN